MTRVKRKKFREYFLKREKGLIARTDVSPYDSYRNLSTPGVFAFLLVGILFILSFLYRSALILLLTDVSGLAGLYFYTFFVAKKLRVKRVTPSRVLREGDRIESIVELRNFSSLSIWGIIVEDYFSPSNDAHVRLAPESIRPKSMLRIAYSRLCDGGMGQRKVGPLVVHVTDPLGIFEFRVTDDSVIMLDVYPRIEPIRDVVVRPSVEGGRYGNYEIQSRGLSVNFSGIRPYERGDSLRHIAWKLSTRGQSLMVKEFERVVSCDVNIVLNLSPQWQIGRNAESTWEYCKDLALSVIKQQLDLGNSVAFFSNESYIESGAGNDHFHLLTRHISGISLTGEKENSRESYKIDPQSILEKYHDFFPRGSNIIYITPFNLAEIQRSEIWMKRLVTERHSVVCVLIDTNTFWLRFLESISTGLLVGAKLMEGIEDSVKELKRSGISTHIASNKVPLKDVFQ